MEGPCQATRNHRFGNRVRGVLKILFLEFWHSEMRFARSQKCLFESLFGHIARYAPSQTFKKALPIAHKSLFQNY